MNIFGKEKRKSIRRIKNPYEGQLKQVQKAILSGGLIVGVKG